MEVSRSQEKNDLERATLILNRLGLTLNDLRNKKVLDLGSGNGELGRAAKRLGLEVISIDKDPFIAQAEDSHRKLIEEHEKKSGEPIEWAMSQKEIDSMYENLYAERKNAFELDIPHLVLGDAMQLPFKDGVFDLIISHASPPTTWTESPGAKRQTIAELARVLRNGGELRFSPVFSYQVNAFRNLGFKLKYREVDKDRGSGYYLLEKSSL